MYTNQTNKKLTSKEPSIPFPSLNYPVKNQLHGFLYNYKDVSRLDASFRCDHPSCPAHRLLIGRHNHERFEEILFLQRMTTLMPKEVFFINTLPTLPIPWSKFLNPHRIRNRSYKGPDPRPDQGVAEVLVRISLYHCICHKACRKAVFVEANGPDYFLRINPHRSYYVYIFFVLLVRCDDNRIIFQYPFKQIVQSPQDEDPVVARPLIRD